MVKKLFYVLIILPFILIFSCSVNWFNDFNELRKEEFSVNYNFYANKEDATSEFPAYFSRRYEIGGTLSSEKFPQPDDIDVQKIASEKVLLGWKFYRKSGSKSSEFPDSLILDENDYVSQIYVSSSCYDFVADWGKLAKYIIKHFKQDISDDNYSEVESDLETKEGVVGAETEASAKDYEGFTLSQPIEQQIILEDGSTIVEIKYNRNKYTVKFDKNGGSGTEIPDRTEKYDVEFELPEHNFAAPDGYRAAEKMWNTEKDGSGTSYDANQTVKNLSVKNDDVVILYAQWQKDEHNSSGVASNPIEDAGKISFALNSGNSGDVSKSSFIKISSTLDGVAVALSDWKVYKNYLGVSSSECVLLKSENKDDVCSSEELSDIYIYADTSWANGEYTLNISAEYNGIGVSKEITINIK